MAVVSPGLTVIGGDVMNKFQDTASIPIYKPARRQDFLLALTLYQVFLGIRYIDISVYGIGNPTAFDWLNIVQPWYISVILFVSSLFNMLNVLTNKWTRLAFISTFLTMCMVSIVWVGSVVVGGNYDDIPTLGIHITVVWITWLSAGVVNTPKKLVEDE